MFYHQLTIKQFKLAIAISLMLLSVGCTVNEPIQEAKPLTIAEQLCQPAAINSAMSKEALQTLEGLSIGAHIVIRYKVANSETLTHLPKKVDEVNSTIIEPALYGSIYKIFAKYTVRETFSTKREGIRSSIEQELKPALASYGLVLQSVQIGSIDLPEDYKRGMDALLAEELASEKMKYTLELKKKQLESDEMQARSDKQQRQVAAEAAASEQVIAAKAQQEAMQYIIPFKQKQIEQRKLEAEAASTSRIKEAQGNAQARLIEATGEASARQKLADAELYRMEKIGQFNVKQMAQEGELISKHPALIQKAMADKLSDKVQVIIAPPSTGSGFIGDALLGNNKP